MAPRIARRSLVSTDPREGASPGGSRAPGAAAPRGLDPRAAAVLIGTAAAGWSALAAPTTAHAGAVVLEAADSRESSEITDSADRAGDHGASGADDGSRSGAGSAPEEMAPNPLWVIPSAESTPAPAAGAAGDAGTGADARPTPSPQAAADTHAPAARGTAARPLADRIAEGTITVRSGESLWSLTRDLLGAQAADQQIAEHWPELWSANAEQIPDPDRVPAGTVLQLPRSLLPAR